MIKSYKITFYLSTFLVTTAAACAGTGQIFSPAGLPQSSTQTYTPPTPDNTPTVTFPTQPLPLGGAVLQGLPGSTLPLSNSNSPPVTTGSSGTLLPLHSNPNTSSIESVFQIPPVAKNINQSTKKKPLKGAAKLIWHTLDNLGVPMFIGKDNDLDPSLRQGYVAPSSAISNRQSVPITPQKIPESELEGTDISPKTDSVIPLH
jgi:hypothetical protein